MAMVSVKREKDLLSSQIVFAHFSIESPNKSSRISQKSSDTTYIHPICSLNKSPNDPNKIRTMAENADPMRQKTNEAAQGPLLDQCKATFYTPQSLGCFS